MSEVIILLYASYWVSYGDKDKDVDRDLIGRAKNLWKESMMKSQLDTLPTYS